MNLSTELNPTHQLFLTEVMNLTKGDIQKVVSMYAIGKTIDLDDQSAKRIAEDMIGLGLLEIKTLSGGICLTETGLSEGKRITGVSDFSGNISKLGNSWILAEQNRQSILKVLEGVKNESGKLGLGFNELKELFADIKTIESQLDSPKPKTKIFYECFVSIKTNLEKNASSESVLSINYLIEP